MTPSAHGITIQLRARRKVVPCPDCGEPTSRIHSRYSRTLADLALSPNSWDTQREAVRVCSRRNSAGDFIPSAECGATSL